MGPQFLAEWLRDAWQLGIGAFLGYLIIDQFWHVVREHFGQSPLKGLVTLMLILSCLIWALSFINVTYMERWSLSGVFAEYQKPSLNALHVALALLFGVLFAVLVSNGWRLSLVIPVALGLALGDIAGNATLIDGIETMRTRAEAAGAPFGPPQMAWYEYYTARPQLERIYAYAAVLTLALVLFLISYRLYRRDNAGRAADAAPIEGVAYRVFRYLASLAFCAAILGNLFTVWSWRLDRECVLAEYEMSFIYGDASQCRP